MKTKIRTIIVDGIEYKWMVNLHSFRIWFNKKEVYCLTACDLTITPKIVAEIIGDLECHFEEQNRRDGSLR